eukprot:3586965-Lingulodinium_polyedra.AAC.1
MASKLVSAGAACNDLARATCTAALPTTTSLGPVEICLGLSLFCLAPRTRSYNVVPSTCFVYKLLTLQPLKLSLMATCLLSG